MNTKTIIAEWNEMVGDEAVDCLPAGFTARAATMADLDKVVAMLNRWSAQMFGLEKFTLADIRTDWQEPGVDLARDSQVVVTPDGEIAGMEIVWDTTGDHTTIRSWGRVDPRHQDKGIGTYLLSWTAQRARQAMAEAPAECQVRLVAWSLQRDEAACRLFDGCGYEAVRYGLRMVVELDDKTLAEPEWPGGITVRPMAAGADDEAVVHAVRESFRDHWGYVEAPFEEELARWRHFIQNDAHFDADIWFLALDGDEVAGVSLCWPHAHDDKLMGWVGTLGVRRPWRRQGLGEALLRHSFRALHARGMERVGLGVDAQSLTGATRLYEKAGMRSDPSHQSVTYHKILRPGIDTSTQAVEE
jgi:mycothiol synthase